MFSENVFRVYQKVKEYLNLVENRTENMTMLTNKSVVCPQCTLTWSLDFHKNSHFWKKR